MSAIEKLKEEVGTTKTVIASAIALITGLGAKLRAALEGDNLEGDIAALELELETSREQLAQAIAANTIAESEIADTQDATGEAVAETTEELASDVAEVNAEEETAA
jgi:hypothetical protein